MHIEFFDVFAFVQCFIILEIGISNLHRSLLLHWVLVHLICSNDEFSCCTYQQLPFYFFLQISHLQTLKFFISPLFCMRWSTHGEMTTFFMVPNFSGRTHIRSIFQFSSEIHTIYRTYNINASLNCGDSNFFGRSEKISEILFANFFS